MSLLDEAMEKCVYLTKTKASDGYGGYVDTYVDGVDFKAAIAFDTSIEARVGEKQGVTSLYTVTTSRGIGRRRQVHAEKRNAGYAASDGGGICDQWINGKHSKNCGRVLICQRTTK